jgi:mannose-1-phosphate guanylyltransferase/phosphomannomutase
LLLGDAGGNLIFPSFYPIADGVFAMVKLMEMLALQEVKLSTVIDALPPYYLAAKKVPCRWENKGKVMRILNEQYTDPGLDQIDGIKIDFGDEWVLVLPDTEGPFFHIIAEGSSNEHAHMLTDKYAGLVANLQ